MKYRTDIEKIEKVVTMALVSQPYPPIIGQKFNQIVVDRGYDSDFAGTVKSPDGYVVDLTGKRLDLVAYDDQRAVLKKSSSDAAQITIEDMDGTPVVGEVKYTAPAAAVPTMFAWRLDSYPVMRPAVPTLFLTWTSGGVTKTARISGAVTDNLLPIVSVGTGLPMGFVDCESGYVLVDFAAEPIDPSTAVPLFTSEVTADYVPMAVAVSGGTFTVHFLHDETLRLLDAGVGHLAYNYTLVLVTPGSPEKREILIEGAELVVRSPKPEIN
jgi:hypothetical protein